MYDHMQMDSKKLIQTEEITEKWQYTIKFAFFFIFMKGEKKMHGLLCDETRR